MARPSRIEAARERARSLKRALAAVAAIGFLGAAILARATHPGHTTFRSSSAGSSGSRSGSTTAAPSTDSGSGSDDDNFSIAPSTAQPQAQTNVS